MMRIVRVFTVVALVIAAASLKAYAQEEEETQSPPQAISQRGYEKSAPAVVKLVADEGKKIGAGVILAVHEDNVGFILTSYDMVAGREKVAVILKNYPDPLLGHSVDKWIDFDSDLAIVAVKNFPADQPVICLQAPRTFQAGDNFTVVGHTDIDDWMPLPFKLELTNDTYLVFGTHEVEGIEGSPVLNEKGNMVGMVVLTTNEQSEEGQMVQAVKTRVIKPLIHNWFQPIKLQQKWCEKGNGVATWVWAVGGGVLGGTIATAIAVAGGGTENPRGLPRPPAPPGNNP
ncbi:MAG: hypothetical protein ACE5HO_20725 [bacterium]